MSFDRQNWIWKTKLKDDVIANISPLFWHVAYFIKF